MSFKSFISSFCTIFIRSFTFLLFAINLYASSETRRDGTVHDLYDHGVLVAKVDRTGLVIYNEKDKGKMEEDSMRAISERLQEIMSNGHEEEQREYLERVGKEIFLLPSKNSAGQSGNSLDLSSPSYSGVDHGSST